MRDQVHVTHVDAGHVFAQVAVRVGFDGHRKIKRVLFEIVRGIGVEFDELNILCRTQLSDGGIGMAPPINAASALPSAIMSPAVK